MQLILPFLLLAARFASASLPNVRCQLPSWPGHPAQACDPKMSTCCPGTKCLKDEQGGLYSCQNALDVASPGDHAAVASALAAHVVTLTTSAATAIGLASREVARANLVLGKFKSALSSEQVLERVSLVTDALKSHADKKKTEPPFDWQQYTPPPKSADDKKKGQDSGFDYSKYTRQAGGNSEGGKSSAVQAKSSASKVVEAVSSTPASPKTTANQAAADASSASEPSADDILVQAAKALLEADAALKLKASSTRDDVLQKARDLLQQALEAIDKASGRSTQAPTSAGFDWRSYLPGDWGRGYNTGDRSPGSLDGPCGESNGKSFGDCKGDNLECLSGTCQVRSAKSQAYVAQVARDANKQANDAAELATVAAAELRAAAAQLMLGAQSLTQADLGGQADTTKELNKTLSYLPPSDSPTFGLLLVGSLVVLYFVWGRVSKRRAYSSIPSDGWGGERA